MFFFVVFDEELGDLALVEDEDFYYRTEAIEFLVDELVGHFQGYCVVNADQEDSRGLLPVLRGSAALAVGVKCAHAVLLNVNIHIA